MSAQRDSDGSRNIRTSYIGTVADSALVALLWVACVPLEAPHEPDVDSGDSSDPVDSGDNPISAAEDRVGEWVWIPVAGSQCRDGSSTGIGVRLHADAAGTLVYFQGGGACYDQTSCEENENAGFIAGKSYSKFEFEGWASTLGTQGIFNLARPSNPAATWNHIYIPYCTGDLHAGRSPGTPVPGVADAQQFVGYENTALFLSLIAPYFADPEQVAAVGASAGGFGVMLNYPQVAEAFDPPPVDMLVDAAPILSNDSVLPTCFQQKLVDTFALRVPDSCEGCGDPTQVGLSGLYDYLGTTYPDALFGFSSADSDFTGVALLNRESVACGEGAVSLPAYRAALYELRDDILEPSGRWSTFFWGGLQHTMTQSDPLFLDNPVQGTTAAEWLAQVWTGTSTQVAP